MDISSLSSNLTQQTALSNAAANKLSSNMKSDYAGASDDELMEACKQFESYFTEQMYKAMMKTIPSNEEKSGSMNTMLDFYKDQMVQSVAEQTTDKEGLGLAQMLYEQMKRNYGTQE